MYQINLEQGYSFGTMLLVLAIAIILAGLGYHRAFGLLKRGQWQLLLGLRAVAILIIVLLLFRPVFSYHREREHKPSLVFLVDRSASMGIADDSSGMSRFNQTRKLVETLWDQTKKDFDLHLVAFAEKAKKLDDVTELSSLLPDGKSTSLVRGLEAASDVGPRQDIEAIVMISDGAHNSAGDPLNSMAGGVKVFTVGVGASLKSDITYRDIQVTGITCPERMMLDNVAKIKGAVEGIGLAGRVIQVALSEDDKPIDQKELTLDDVEGSQEVEFEFRPNVKGRHTYKVFVTPAAEEKISENNQRSAISLVVEPGIRVLYVEGTLRAEYGALVDRFLSKDPDLEFVALVQTRPNHFSMRSNFKESLNLNGIPSDPEMVAKFDVFIIGDIDSSYFKAQQQELIVHRVKNGGGLVMLGGYHSLGPGGYDGSPLGEILPVNLGTRDVGQVTEAFLPQLTPEGSRHPVFANIADFFPTKTGQAKTEGLPPLNGCTRIQGAKPGTTVLAICPNEADAMPILALQPAGKGYSMVFTGDTTRNWQQGLRARDQKTPFLQFWGQVVRFLAGRSNAVETKSSIAATTNKAYYEPDELVQVSAIVRDEQGEGTDKAKVVLKSRGPGGRSDTVAMTVVPGPGGHYQGALKPESPGTYEIVVEAKVEGAKEGESVSSEKLTVEVSRPNLEFEKLDLNERLLSKLASGSGGRYFHITTANQLLQQLDRSVRKKQDFVEKPLFHPPLFWIIFVAALTTEWILRRRTQLR